MSDILNPEGVLMLFLAGMLDLIGIICLILDAVFSIGEILSPIPDFIGICFFGIWIFMRSQGEKTKKESMKEVSGAAAEHKKRVAKTKKIFQKGTKKASKKGLKFVLAMFGELIPFLGALPFWTIFVYSELKQK